MVFFFYLENSVLFSLGNLQCVYYKVWLTVKVIASLND